MLLPLLLDQFGFTIDFVFVHLEYFKLDRDRVEFTPAKTLTHFLCHDNQIAVLTWYS